MIPTSLVVDSFMQEPYVSSLDMRPLEDMSMPMTGLLSPSLTELCAHKSRLPDLSLSVWVNVQTSGTKA